MGNTINCKAFAAMEDKTAEQQEPNATLVKTARIYSPGRKRRSLAETLDRYVFGSNFLAGAVLIGLVY